MGRWRDGWEDSPWVRSWEGGRGRYGRIVVLGKCRG